MLVRHAAGGLLDEEDTKLIGKLVKAFDTYRMPGIIRIHIYGPFALGLTHVDAHLCAGYWPVDRAHVLAESFRPCHERLRVEGEIVSTSIPATGHTALSVM